MNVTSLGAGPVKIMPNKPTLKPMAIRLALIPLLSILAIVATGLALPEFLVPAILIVWLSLMALHSGVLAGYRKTDDSPVKRNKLLYARTLSLTLAVPYAMLALGPIGEAMSWPRRDVIVDMAQGLACIGLVFHLGLLLLSFTNGKLPLRTWPLRIAGIAVGVVVSDTLPQWQWELAQQRFQKQQQALVTLLEQAPDRCAALHDFLEKHPPERAIRKPQLHVDGGRFILSYPVFINWARMIMYHDSSEREWHFTYGQMELRVLDDLKSQMQPCEEAP